MFIEWKKWLDPKAGKIIFIEFTFLANMFQERWEDLKISRGGKKNFFFGQF